MQVRMVVKHVSNEELKAIPTAADDLFIIGGKGAFEKRQQDQQQKQVRVAAVHADAPGAPVPT
jgi:hypothetical protein